MASDTHNAWNIVTNNPRPVRGQSLSDVYLEDENRFIPDDNPHFRIQDADRFTYPHPSQFRPSDGNRLQDVGNVTGSQQHWWIDHVNENVGIGASLTVPSQRLQATDPYGVPLQSNTPDAGHVAYGIGRVQPILQTYSEEGDPRDLKKRKGNVLGDKVAEGVRDPRDEVHPNEPVVRDEHGQPLPPNILKPSEDVDMKEDGSTGPTGRPRSNSEPINRATYELITGNIINDLPSRKVGGGSSGGALAATLTPDEQKAENALQLKLATVNNAMSHQLEAETLNALEKLVDTRVLAKTEAERIYANSNITSKATAVVKLLAENQQTLYADITDLKYRFNSLRIENAELQGVNTKLNATLTENNKTLRQYEAKNADFNTAIQFEKEEKTKIQNTLAQKEAAHLAVVDGLKKEINTLRELQADPKSIETLTTKLHSAQAELKTSQDEMKVFQETTSTKENTFQVQKIDLENQLKALKEKNAVSETEFKNQLDAKTNALERELKDSKQQVLIAEDSLLMRLNELKALKDKQQDEISKYGVINRSLESDVLNADRRIKGLRETIKELTIKEEQTAGFLKKANTLLRSVTDDKDILLGDQKKTAAEKKALEEMIQQHSEKIERLNIQYESAVQTLNANNVALLNEKAQVIKEMEILTMSNSSMSTQIQDMNTLLARLSNIEQEQKVAVKRAEMAEAQSAQLRNEVDQLTVAITGKQATIDDYEGKMEVESTSELARLEKLLAKTQSELDDLNKKGSAYVAEKERQVAELQYLVDTQATKIKTMDKEMKETSKNEKIKKDALKKKKKKTAIQGSSSTQSSQYGTQGSMISSIRSAPYTQKSVHSSVTGNSASASYKTQATVDSDGDENMTQEPSPVESVASVEASEGGNTSRSALNPLNTDVAITPINARKNPLATSSEMLGAWKSTAFVNPALDAKEVELLDRETLVNSSVGGGGRSLYGSEASVFGDSATDNGSVQTVRTRESLHTTGSGIPASVAPSHVSGPPVISDPNPYSKAFNVPNIFGTSTVDSSTAASSVGSQFSTPRLPDKITPMTKALGSAFLVVTTTPRRASEIAANTLAKVFEPVVSDSNPLSNEDIEEWS